MSRPASPTNVTFNFFFKSARFLVSYYKQKGEQLNLSSYKMKQGNSAILTLFWRTGDINATSIIQTNIQM